MAELAVGHISIVADTSKLPGQIKKSLGGASGYGADVGNSIGSKISSGIGKTLKAGVAGVGVAAGGALAGSITKGLGRLTGIETAQAKLKGLGNDAKDVDAIMDNALASVKGTSFGLGEAATTAAGAVAAGIKPGKELEDVLKSVANSASATGSGMDEMGGIFNKVASIGKAQNDVLSQVADRGLPIYQALADQLGVTTDEVFKMASAGEIGFAEFEAAMTQAAGTVAEELGGTTVGTLQNVGSAMGRFGESLLAPAFSAAPSLFGGIITVFDEMTDAVKPVSEELGNILTPALEDFAGIIETRVAPMAGEAVGKIGDIVLAITDKALEPGTWEKFGDVFTTIKDVVAEMWPSIESLAGSFLTVTQNVSVTTWQILASALDALAPLIESVLIPLVEKVADFTEQNPGVVEKIVMAFLGFKAVGAIAGPVGTAASTLGTLSGAVKGVSGAFKGASLGKGLLNLMGMAKSANPILARLGGVVGTVFKVFWKIGPVLMNVGKIFGTVIRFINPWVGALTLVTGALTWFFTKTELGQQIWEAMTTAIAAGWEWLKETLAATWETIKTAVFDAWESSVNWLQETWAIVTGAISTAWTWLKDTLVAAWEAIKEFVINAWNAYWSQVKSNFELVTGALNVAWTWLKDMFVAVWNAIKEFVVAAFEQAWTNLKNNFQLVMGLLNAAWTWLKDMLVAVWNVIRDTVINAFQTALEGLRAFFQNIMDRISTMWSGFKDHLHTVWVWVKENVFDAIGRGLDQVRGWFQSAVDAIRDIWNGIKSAAAKPVKFVVETVYNNGIRKAWNAVAGFVGLDELAPVSLGDLGNYASGGVLPGYTPGRDPYTFIEPTTGMRIGLSGGEAIVRPEATRVLGSDWVDGVNAAAKTGGTAGVQKFLGGFANGGIVESISAAVRKHFPMMTITSTYRNTNDHHGAGRAVDFSNGTDSTPEMRAAAQWFYANYGPGLLELIHSPFNNNVKDGANVGDGFGFYGAGTMNQHRNHVHVAAPAPLGDPSVMVEMIEDAGGSGFSLSGMVKKLWDKAIGAIGEWTGGGLIGSLPGAMLSTLAGAAWDFVSERVGKFFGAGGTAGSAESWREMAMAAMRRQGFNADDPAQVNAMLAQIASESGGDPNIAQQIVDVNGTGESAGVGLLQIIPGTFEAYRDPELPNDRRDPWANMNAALRYYRARYGTDLTTMWGKGHGYARGGVLPGFTPGRDVHRFFSPTGGTLALSGGEAIMRPEWTRAVGGAGAVNSMNRAAMRGGNGVLPGSDAFEVLKEAAQHLDNAAKELGLQEQARKSAEDYAAEQASGLLSTFGLEVLVPLAQKAGAQAWEAYQASPYDVGVNGQTIVVEYVGDENDREWKMLQKLDKEVALLKAKRKPKASAMTRGGVQ